MEKTKWDIKLDQLIKFIIDNKKTPIANGANADEDENIIGAWFNQQKVSYKNGLITPEIRKNEWEKFILNYGSYFHNNDKLFKKNFAELIVFFRLNGKPSIIAEDANEKKLNNFFKKNDLRFRDGSLKDFEKSKWKELIEEFPYLHEDNLTIRFRELKEFKNENKRLPHYSTTNLCEDSLANWVGKIRTKFQRNLLSEDIIKKFNELDPNLLQNVFETRFNDHFNELGEFLKNNNFVYPARNTENDIEMKLYVWIMHQTGRYDDNKMSIEERNKWEELFKKYPKICSDAAQKLCNKCNVCFQRSIASSFLMQFWSYEKNINENGNKIDPKLIFRHSNFSYWFNCSYHEFLKKLCAVSYVEGEENYFKCPYPCCQTGSKILCDVDDCVICTEASFASCDKALYWDYTKNIDENGKVIRPRDICKGVDTKFWFLYENKPYYATLGSITNGAWCCSVKGISIREICWLEQIMASENILIQHALNEKQFYINAELPNGTVLKTKVDGYCKENNTIYEFHGDYWHGNPKNPTIKLDDVNQYNKKTFRELYNQTLLRDQQIRDLGYNLIIMWEFDFEDNINKKIMKSVKERIEKHKHKPKKENFYDKLWDDQYKNLKDVIIKLKDTPVRQEIRLDDTLISLNEKRGALWLISQRTRLRQNDLIRIQETRGTSLTEERLNKLKDLNNLIPNLIVFDLSLFPIKPNVIDSP